MRATQTLVKLSGEPVMLFAMGEKPKEVRNRNRMPVRMSEQLQRSLSDDHDEK